MIPNLLTIAGSDPSGGAGIQADLKTFSALGCYGMSVITALTAQNTQGVQGIYPVPPAFVREQLQSVFADIRINAVKTGMLGDVALIETIAEFLKDKKTTLVVDPVMTAQSGDMLVSAAAMQAMRKTLFPLAAVITPNLPEAEALLGRVVLNAGEAAKELLQTGAKAVLLKGGHSAGAIATDVLATAKGTEIFEAPRVKTKNNHGTGCTLAAAIASHLARGADMAQAVRAAKSYITEALKQADKLKVGHGAGPVHHFHAWWKV